MERAHCPFFFFLRRCCLATSQTTSPVDSVAEPRVVSFSSASAKHPPSLLLLRFMTHLLPLTLACCLPPPPSLCFSPFLDCYSPDAVHLHLSVFAEPAPAPHFDLSPFAPCLAPLSHVTSVFISVPLSASVTSFQ